MRNSLQTAFAIVAGVLLVGAAALGGAFMQPGVDSMDDAAGQYVERGEGQVALGAGIVVGAAAYYTYDNYIKNEPTTDSDALQKTDAEETEKEIYDQASIQDENSELTSTAYANYLNDTESIALMEGKNAYIRALENGSSESVARNRAREAVADYYAVKQQNVIAAWNISVTVTDSARTTANNTTGVNSSYIGFDGEYTQDSNNEEHEIGWGTGTETISLVNSTDETIQYALIDPNGTHLSGTTDYNFTAEKISLTTGYYEHTDSYGTMRVRGFGVEPPNDNFEYLQYLNLNNTADRWAEIEQQNDEVQSQLDTFVNNTYDSYQQGEINESELVDPYLGAREYDPETSDTWTLRTLSAMSIDAPQNLSNLGRMNVTADGTTYTGTLMSDGKPADGYAVGGTYNASNITGAQFVALDDGDTVELEGTFTLESVETADGEQLAENETVEYRDINYQTANTSEFKALQEDLDQLTAEINARQQEQRNAGGGGLLPDFGAGGAIPGVLLLAGAAVFVLGRN
ncbi:hypothetical protein [Halobacterium sp. R2-5]|uniref:hypothetical protein n=1 Tax=Halobacterium sp. R2-5 TaxID=2715751 RepID=UPI00141F9FA1|nr:hypothetical protein [Halobacterium sp. R2-5]NIC01079.1 hypothetical protein [Halobacterium sp. R2-5]